MAMEIERKFLLASDAWRGLAPGVLYRQGYLQTEKRCAVRVRVVGDRAFLTIKGRVSPESAHEYEYPIPLTDAREMLEHLAQRPLVEKLRHRVPWQDGLVWEIDEFLGENAGLILAEVELRAPDQEVALPDWIGPEVTGDPRYYNANLVRNPYRLWDK
jgi:CYTH domain-containing protein